MVMLQQCANRQILQYQARQLMQSTKARKHEQSKPEKKTLFKNLLFPKRSWTEEQDELLISVVEKHGPHRWSYIARFIPNRLGKQCRERWFNHLDPSINKEKWTEEEEWRLFLGNKLYGTRWAKISKLMAGRTDNTIKNHWNSIMKKKIPELQERLSYLSDRSPLKDLAQSQAIARLLNIEGEGLQHLTTSFQNQSLKQEQLSATEPQMCLKKSSDSDDMSFEHILKRIDKNEEEKLERLQSYNYDCTLQENGNKRNSGVSQRQQQKPKCDQPRNKGSKAVVDKQNRFDGCQDLFEQVDNFPLPPLLTKQSSLDYKLKFLASPSKPM